MQRFSSAAIFCLAVFAALFEGAAAAHLVSRTLATDIAVKTKAIAELNTQSFKESVADPTGSATISKWVVLFHSTGDAQSKLMMPSFETMLARMLGRDEHFQDIGFAKVDCSKSEDLCSKLQIAKFPSVLYYQDRQVVAEWTSGVTGLVPWLQKELSKRTQDDASATLGMQSFDQAWDVAWQAIDATRKTRRAIFEVSHLEAVHDLIFMEDCDFSRLLSFTLLIAILGKTAGIVFVDGVELRLSRSMLSGWFSRQRKQSATQEALF
eukprot:TRINITY_DN101802_c0_g1_i1.p1 TRINITY_DN101802_c0_g1~~TRINITY_DN101802_c0_g1_i1.p1  ORF type:complete len:266 (-),score=82.71 TRINITY_DN101802_c0_g1_i1:43-840(-)